ncbi:hypothetical protein INR49_001232 [Caranx melampygus]|nr:hypothetical protein INR49_001232 [Caranx melampygus]
MEVTALCFRLLMLGFLLLETHVHSLNDQQRGAASLRLTPDRLQFFIRESVSFHCEGTDGSAQLKRTRDDGEFSPICVMKRTSSGSSSSCTAAGLYPIDSGEYWCETDGGERSNSINITITGGSVILESPALPVMEGNPVTLRCRNRTPSTNVSAAFYKDGLSIQSGRSSTLTISRVSRSDEGLYSCSISGAGESTTSRLTVTDRGGVILEVPALPVMEGDAVTLHCWKNTSSNVPAVFYKDDVFIGTSSTGTMNIQHVYLSHEGLYKCSVQGVGESAESRLTVRELHRDTSSGDTCLFSDNFVHVLLLMRTIFTVVMVVLQLLLLGRLHCGKLGRSEKKLLNLLLLVPHSQEGGVSGADVVIVPSRLQLFEYEAVSFSCQGSGVSPEWRVRNIKVNISTCQKSTSSVNCTNSNAVVSDSGEHWCEGPGGERSSAVNVTVTGGSVVLDGPVLPVTEGEAVTLSCRSRSSVSNHTAGFYRDGLFVGSSSTGTMTVENVSTAHGGLYKCHMSGAGESPQSPLTVRGQGTWLTTEHQISLVSAETSPSSDPSVPLFTLRTVLIVLLVVLQLLVVGLLCCGKLGPLKQTPV